MKRRHLIFFAGVLGIAALALLSPGRHGWVAAQVRRDRSGARVISVELAKAQRKPVPVDVDSIGTVTPISSVALKSRVETTIVSVHFADGAKVSEGDHCNASTTR